MNEKFIVTFYDEDKVTVLDKQEVEKGEKVSYKGKTPEKPAINGIEYTFVGWETTGNMMMVMEDIELFAKYDESTKVGNKDDNAFFQLSEENAENAKLDKVMEAGNKVNNVLEATKNMTIEQKKDLVNEVMDKGSVDLDRENQNERD